jgi:cyclase
MPLTTRIIPCLDVADGRVVKGVNFVNLIDAGDPVELAHKYFLEGADEITFLDINASKQGRSTVTELVSRTARSVFIPLTVGGGVRSVDDVAKLLEAGADKISISSAALLRPELVSEIANKFGSQVLVVSLDLKRTPEHTGGFTVTSHGGSKEASIDAIEWVKRVQELGAGELLVNSIDTDGTKSGFDIELLQRVLEVATVPVIASGGAGRVEDFVNAAETGVNALLAASVFHSNSLSISTVKSALVESGAIVRQAA